MKQYVKALEFLKRSQVIWENSDGPDHPDVAYALDQQGEYLLKLGDPSKASRLSCAHLR